MLKINWYKWIYCKSALPAEQRKWNWPEEVLYRIWCDSMYKWITKEKHCICWTNLNLLNSRPHPVGLHVISFWPRHDAPVLSHNITKLPNHLLHIEKALKHSKIRSTFDKLGGLDTSVFTILRISVKQRGNRNAQRRFKSGWAISQKPRLQYV